MIKMINVGDHFNKDNYPEILGRILIVGVVISMTRAFALTSLFEFLLVSLFVFNRGLRKELRNSLRDTRVLLPLMFWLWIFVSGFWSLGSMSDWLEDWWSWRKLMLIPMSFILFKDHSAKVVLMIGLVSIASVFMVSSWAGFFGLITLDRAPHQLLENHATQGVVFTTAAISLVLLAGTVTRGWVVAFCILLVIGFLSNNIFLSTGRSTYLFMVVALGVMVYLRVGPKFRVFATIGVVVVILGLLASVGPFKERVNLAIEQAVTAYEAEKISSLGVRVVMWSNTIRVIEKNWIAGTGSGGFSVAYKEEVADEGGWRSRVVDDPHQQYLHILAEYGILGLFLFLLALTAIALTILRAQSIFVTLALSILAGTFMNGFANGHFSAFVEGRLVWIFCFAMISGSPDVFGPFVIRISKKLHQALGRGVCA